MFVLVYVAGYLVRKQDEVRTHFVGFIKPMLVMAVLIVLLLAEPDFGAAVVMTASVMGMLFLGGARLWQFVALSAVTLAVNDNHKPSIISSQRISMTCHSEA